MLMVEMGGIEPPSEMPYFRVYAVFLLTTNWASTSKFMEPKDVMLVANNLHRIPPIHQNCLI